MQNLLEMGVKNHKAWLKSEFHHICLLVCLCAIDIWSRSSFRVTPYRVPHCWCRQNNRSCTEICPFTDCNKTHFCCNCFIHSLVMKPFYWFKWDKWLKMAFNKLGICYSIPEAITYNWLPNTHTHTCTHDQQQLQTKRNWALHISC